MNSSGPEQGLGPAKTADANLLGDGPTASDQGRESRQRMWTRMRRAAMWAITLGLLTVAMLRVLCHDNWDPLIWFNAFTLYVYLPAYIVAAVAVLQRRWLLAGLNALIIACHLTWIAPDFQPAAPTQPAALADISRTVKIFCANIRATSPDHESVLKEIASVDPDIVVLIEYRRWWTHSLRESPVLRPYVYGTNLAAPYNGEVGVFSRIPISNQQMIWVETHVNNVVDISLGNSSLRLFALHSPRPFYEQPFDYGGFWRQELPLLSRQPRPLVVIGDFNATQYSRVYQDLTSMGLRSAHVDRGRGYATTWPNGDNPLPPIRIDQAFLSPQVECLSITEGIGLGSDHKPLILEIRLRVDRPMVATMSTASTAGK
jgi:endonuclease/exonuclease/phosphatase (EEP) superfamily protein YafD